MNASSCMTEVEVFFNLCVVWLARLFIFYFPQHAHSGLYLLSICVVFQHLGRSGLWWKHVGQRFCCYVASSDVAPAAHRYPYNTSARDARSLA